MKNRLFISLSLAGVLVGIILAVGACETDDGARPEVVLEAPTNHPNSPEYRGGGLEMFEYFELTSGLKLDQAKKTTIIGVAHSGISGAAFRFPLRLTVTATDPCVNGAKQVLEAKGENDARPQDVLLFTVEARDGKGFKNLCSGKDDSGHESLMSYPKPWTKCEDGAVGQGVYAGKAVAIPGYIDSRGDYVNRVDAQGKPTSYTFSCMTGATAKCVHWGYRPWDLRKPISNSDPLNVETYEDYFRACIHATRADYRYHETPNLVGKPQPDVRAFTCPGVWFGIVDKAGIQFDEPRFMTGALAVDSALGVAADDKMDFESKWGKLGELCHARHRFDKCDYEVDPVECKDGGAPVVAKPLCSAGSYYDPKSWGPGQLISVSSYKHTDECPLHTGCAGIIRLY